MCCAYSDREWSKTAKGDDSKVGRTVRPITQDKKRTWICELKLTFVQSCSWMRLQLYVHFYVVFKMRSTFTDYSLRKRRWRHLNFSENRNERCNQSKSWPEKHKDYDETFLLLPKVIVAVVVWLSFLIECSRRQRNRSEPPICSTSALTRRQ